MGSGGALWCFSCAPASHRCSTLLAGSGKRSAGWPIGAHLFSIHTVHCTVRRWFRLVRQMSVVRGVSASTMSRRSHVSCCRPPRPPSKCSQSSILQQETRRLSRLRLDAQEMRVESMGEKAPLGDTLAIPSNSPSCACCTGPRLPNHCSSASGSRAESHSIVCQSVLLRQMASQLRHTSSHRALRGHSSKQGFSVSRHQTVGAPRLLLCSWRSTGSR